MVISGTATDTGGLVGGVEISFDGGATWHPATGRSNWSYSWTPAILGSAVIKSRATDDSGNIETPGGGVAVTVGARTCPCDLWGTGTPSIVESNDTNSVELGFRFRSDVNGFVTGVRFYKGPSNTGTHLGHLWTNDGTLLASATFTNESASGWQQVSFPSAIAITAGTTYLASYFAPNGNYSINDLYFASSGADSPPLHALQDGVDGPNGVFSYSATPIFPSSTFQSRNYWVDVVFSTTLGGSGPTVTSTVPLPGSTGVSSSTAVSATFDKALDPTTVTSTTFRLLDPSSNVVPASVTYNASTRTATLAPTTPLGLVATYSAVITGGSGGVKDTSGNPMASTVSWIFSTCCSVWNASATPAMIDSGDGASVEVGFRFRSDLSGFITALRFYKSAANIGTHVGHLWTNDGIILASATFTGESASGWQQVVLPTPVPISAGTTYVASYFAPSGHYSLDEHLFASSGVDNPPLHALKDGTDGANGVFTYGATSLFPTSSFHSSNYWVDVVLNPVSLASLTLNPTSVTGGNSSTGTVTLTGPAPTGGAIVALATDNSAAQLPPSVTVAGGALSASFNVATTAIGTPATANISGTYATTKSSALTINPTSLASVTLNPSTLIGGASSTGTVHLSAGAPAGGATVQLQSSNSTVATVPPSVTISSGATSATFTITTSVVATSTAVVISGTYGATQTATLTVNPPSPPGVAIDVVTSTDRTSPSTSVTSPAFSTAVPNELLLAFISSDSNASGGVTVNSVTGGGLTWALVKRTNAQPGGAEIWRAFATSTLTGATVTATLSESVVSSITVMAYTGADPSGINGSGAIGATGSANAASGAPSASLVTTRNNSWVFGVGTDWDRAVARTLGANQTMVHQFLTNVGSTYWVQRQNSVTPLSGTTVTINDTAPTNDKYDLSIVEILSAVLGPPDFSIAATPDSQTVLQGSGATYTVNVAAFSGFSGTVTLSASGLPVGATATFSPATITGSGTSTLTINTLTSTPVGTSTLTISGVSGSTSHSTTVSLVVTAPPPPGQLAIDKIVSGDRTTESTSVTTTAFSTTVPNELLLAFISADSAPPASVTVSGVAGGGLTWTLVKRTNTQPGGAEIWRAFATSILNNATVTATLSQNVVSSITVVTFTGADSSGTNGSGAIGATGGASAAAGSPTASLVTTRNNSWVFGVGTDWDSATARTLGTSQTMLHQFLTNVGSTYWVQRQNSVTPLSGSTVTINDTAPSADKYDLSIVEVLPATLGPPDFSFSSDPSSQTVQQGHGTTYTVSVGASGGFSGTVNLSASGLPAGATATFNPATIAGSGTSTLTISTLSSTPAGTSTLTLTGVSGSLSHTSTVTLVVATPPPPGQLAIDTVISTDRTSAATTVTTPAFSTTVPNELLLAFVSADSISSGGLTVTSVTGGNLTWVLVKRTNAQPGGAEIWRAFATSALSNVTVTANLSQNVVSSITVVSFTGADSSGTNGSGAVGATGGGSAAVGAPTASLVTTRNNSWVFGVGTDWDNAASRTLGPTQSMVHQFLTNVGSTYWVQRQTSVSALSGATVTINDTAPSNDKYNLSIVEVLPAPL